MLNSIENDIVNTVWHKKFFDASKCIDYQIEWSWCSLDKMRCS